MKRSRRSLAIWRWCLAAALGVSIQPAVGRAGGLREPDRLVYSDLLQVADGVQDPGLRARRELRALTHLLRHPPRHPNGRAAPGRPRAPLTLEAIAGGGAALVRSSDIYLSGESSTADYQEATGANVDLSGVASADVLRRGRLTVAAELDPGLRILPVAGQESQLGFQAPLLLPFRIDLPIPLIIAPTLSVSWTRAQGEALTRLEPGLTAAIFVPGRAGLTGVRARLATSTYRAMVTAGTVGGNAQQLEPEPGSPLRYGAGLSGVQLIPLIDPWYRLKLELSAGTALDDRLVYQGGLLVAQPWASIQGEARAGAEAELTRGFGMGLEAFAALGCAGPPGGEQQRQTGFGGEVWLGALIADRVDLAATMDLRRIETTLLTASQAQYQVTARWGVYAGVRF